MFQHDSSPYRSVVWAFLRLLQTLSAGHGVPREGLDHLVLRLFKGRTRASTGLAVSPKLGFRSLSSCFNFIQDIIYFLDINKV